MILYEGPSLIDNTPIIVIATEDENPKTGRVLMTWILRQDRPPEVAAYDGSDAAICGDCKFRAMIVENNLPWPGQMLQTRTCYVRLSPSENADEAMPPSEVWRRWMNQKYEDVEVTDWEFEIDPYEQSAYLQYVGSLPVRIGSYGDPAAVPTRVWAELVRYAPGGWTGFTHLWKPRESCDPELRRYCMASVDTLEERAEAQALGWRTFMVVPEKEKSVGVWEAGKDILCPATDPHPRRGKVCGHCEGRGWMDIGPDTETDCLTIESCIGCGGTGRVSTTCATCGLCNGTNGGKSSKSIWEVVHGKNKENHKW